MAGTWYTTAIATQWISLYRIIHLMQILRTNNEKISNAKQCHSGASANERKNFWNKYSTKYLSEKWKFRLIFLKKKLFFHSAINNRFEMGKL